MTDRKVSSQHVTLIERPKCAADRKVFYSDTGRAADRKVFYPDTGRAVYRNVFYSDV